MSDIIDSEVVALNGRIFANRLRLVDVLKQAGVNRSTWSRWTHGAEPKRSTLRKVSEAIDAKIGEKESATGRR